jgi:hypothetical protein
MSGPPSTGSAAGRSVADVVRAARCSHGEARLMLGQVKRAGRAEQIGPLWRLTAHAERDLGAGLRELRVDK